MRILYATDGSEGSLAAGRFMTGLPFDANTHVHIITVLAEDSRESGSIALEAARRSLGEFPGRVTTATGRGENTSEIVETLLWTANYLGADMIVVGARGRSAMARFFLGSVAEGLARHATIPVLLARAGGLPLREVIFGIDGSPDSHNAAHWAVSSFPIPDNCLLRLVRAVTPPVWLAYPDAMFAGAYDRTLDELALSERQTAKKALEALRTELKASERTISIETRGGNPATELLSAVERTKAGLLVVGSRGLTGVSRFLLGSVSSNVIHHAHCSVLLVRPPDSPDPEVIK
jgi:nucleotide-binding universal stress UspA family protein